MYVKFSEMELALAETENMQQTPNPAAQLPWAEPLLAEHSEDVRQVLERSDCTDWLARGHLLPIAVGGAGGGAGRVGELDDAEEAEDLGGPGGAGGVVEQAVRDGHGEEPDSRAEAPHGV